MFRAGRLSACGTRSGEQRRRSVSQRLRVPGISLAFLAGLAVAPPAFAHKAPTGWTYPFSCCANLDCREVSDSAISEKPEGYVVKATGEVIGYKDIRVKNSPDGLFHWCAHQGGLDAGRTICLFVPPRDF